ncbi:chemotaxis protein CheW [Dyella solisilvae]|uniref:Chemotaxis protein CheW n=1 Tax=Dyella solisilvae TaxID=1920168 RepID=A0A370K507_9GAMM|nr:chemotaxis protein CheW [Dyella solisilvae]RDI97751.1 chemotaxis protein CheW [Dyella solisilvae]
MIDTQTAGSDQRWLSFRVGAQLYAAPLGEISEVIRDGEITPVPGAAGDLLGIRHLRGRIVPVLDGRRRLGLDEGQDLDVGQIRLIMLSHGAHLVGLRVDAIGDLVSPGHSGIAPPPPGAAARVDDPVYGVIPWQGSFVALLDVGRLCRLPAESEVA